MLIQLYYTISSVSDIIELSDVMPDTATKRLPQIGILDSRILQSNIFGIFRMITPVETLND